MIHHVCFSFRLCHFRLCYPLWCENWTSEVVDPIREIGEQDCFKLFSWHVNVSILQCANIWFWALKRKHFHNVYVYCLRRREQLNIVAPNSVWVCNHFEYEQWPWEWIDSVIEVAIIVINGFTQTFPLQVIVTQESIRNLSPCILSEMKNDEGHRVKNFPN